MNELYEISIRQFMQCMHEGKFDVVGGYDNWDQLYTKYVDASGAADTKECLLMRNINNVHAKIVFVQEIIGINHKFLDIFSIPFLPSLLDLKKTGHRLKWNNDVDDFKKQLNRVEVEERSNVAEMDLLVSDLEKLKKEGLKASKIEKNDRKDFVRQITIIAKHNNRAIDRDKIDMEEYCIMIKDYSDYVEESLKKE